ICRSSQSGTTQRSPKIGAIQTRLARRFRDVAASPREQRAEVLLLKGLEGPLLRLSVAQTAKLLKVRVRHVLLHCRTHRINQLVDGEFTAGKYVKCSSPKERRRRLHISPGIDKNDPFSGVSRGDLVHDLCCKNRWRRSAHNGYSQRLLTKPQIGPAQIGLHLSRDIVLSQYITNDAPRTTLIVNY